jgi:thiamine-phosphate pyrophosphorylase
VSLPTPPVLVITDRKQARRPLELVAAGALRAGCRRWILLREEDLPAAQQTALAHQPVGLAAPFGARTSWRTAIHASATRRRSAASRMTAGSEHLSKRAQQGWQ